MSSIVAGKTVMSAEGDVADVDDGESAVSAGAFWPVISLHDLRLAARITGGITTSRLMHAATEAVAHVIDQLSDWQTEQEQAGYATLQDVPATQINDESRKVHSFRRAVYAITRAFVLEGYRDVDTTAKGDRVADAMDMQRDELWRDARWSIADIRGVRRVYAELC
ncbi:putative phage protein [Trabulsiella guamensis ATCC 49490]|uniref:Putative phage protein n=1 Tax=Trabulsiella guamensis ATCC 49490 TaxID=1005994 RepID=A0A084ZPS1_9ENTR|nr:head completion/stabilization protein [Trabulsiella guamensis]KFB99465.1 putative phage protein [Trabulsiella guamensis ATCC 49490]